MIVWRVSAPGDNGKSSASTRVPYSRHQGVDRSQQGSRPRFRFDRIRAVFAHRLVTPPPEITRKCRFWCRRLTQPVYSRAVLTPTLLSDTWLLSSRHGRRAIPGNVFQDGQSPGDPSHQAGQRGTDAVSATQVCRDLALSLWRVLPTPCQ